MDLHTIRIGLLGIGLLIFVAEALSGLYKGLFPRKVMAVGLLCFGLALVVPQQFSRVIDAVVGALLDPWSLKGALADVPVVWGTLGVLLVSDFCFYWGHRFAHEGMKKPRLAWLWKLHRTHHAGKFMNITLTARINPFWYLVVPTAWVYAMAIYLGLGKSVGYALMVVFGYNLFTHTHFRWDDWLRDRPVAGRVLRAVEHILITPGLHHTHHGWGSADGKTYRNFAVMFAFYDWIFGTLHIPNGRPRYYGLPGDYPHWAEEVFYPLYRAKPEGARAAQTQPGARPLA